MCRFEKQLWKPFHYFNFDTLPRVENFLFTMKFFRQFFLYVNNICDKFKGQKSHTKEDMQNLPTYVAVRIHFNTTNFDTLPRAEFSFLYYEFFFTIPYLY